MKFYLCEKRLKLSEVLSLLKSISNLTEVKETEKIINANMRDFGKKAAFKFFFVCSSSSLGWRYGANGDPGFAVNVTELG